MQAVQDNIFELTPAVKLKPSYSTSAWLKAGLVFGVTTSAFLLAKSSGVLSWVVNGLFDVWGVDSDGAIASEASLDKYTLNALDISPTDATNQHRAIATQIDNFLADDSDIAQVIWQSPIALGSLNGINGFKIDGEASGWSVSQAGDINGDKVDDLIIGAFAASDKSGRSYVVFGHNGTWSPTFNLTTLNGINGFRIDGTGGDESGYSVSQAGDISGDKVDDLIIGTFGASSHAGRSYMIFGHNGTWSPIFNLTTLDGINGFKINGEASGDESGYSVSQAGDINGDKVDDLVIGAPRASRSYVIFGHNGTWTPAFNLTTLNGINGFKLDGEDSNDVSGWSVNQAGDINGDKASDLIIGAFAASSRAGRSYVVFGHDGTWSPALNLTTLNGLNGFKINGETDRDKSGYSVSQAGDINGDKVDDLIIGAPDASGQSGRSYVIFGHNGTWNSTFNLATLNGINGFKINGEILSDQSGYSVSQTGDINGDKVDDLIIGAPGASHNAGRSYVIFGHNGTWNSSFNLVTLNGINGFKINGEILSGQSGYSVSQAGDINGDKVDDLIIGASYSYDSNASRSYVFFSQRTADFKISNLLSSQANCCTVGLGQSYNFAFSNDSFIAPTPITTYSAVLDNNAALPGWLSFNSTTRTFFGTPIDAVYMGLLDLKLIASYGLLSRSQTFTLNITQTLSAINITQVINYRENTKYDLADIVIATPSSTTTAMLTLSDTNVGKFIVATRGNVTSSYNPATGTWQASGDIANVNILLANLYFQPTTNVYRGYTVKVVITDAYGQRLDSAMNAVGSANIVNHPAQLIGGIVGGILGAMALVATGSGIAIYKYRKKCQAAETEIWIDLAEPRSWAFDLSLKPEMHTVKHYKLIPAGEVDLRRVIEAYQHSPVPNMDIKSVKIVYSPNLEQVFAARVKTLQERASSMAFAARWVNDGQLALRGAIMERLGYMAAPHKEEKYSAVKLLPVWHGTRPENLDSIFKSGYANLATTDAGFFGKGLYSAYEAQYAYKTYYKGALLVNWVSFFSAFPVVDGDMHKIQGKGNYGSYDAHFVPVKPASADPNEQSYFPCSQLEEIMYHEIVVFDAAQCLPRYLVELQPSLPKEPSLGDLPRAHINIKDEQKGMEQMGNEPGSSLPKLPPYSRFNEQGSSLPKLPPYSRFFAPPPKKDRQPYRIGRARTKLGEEMVQIGKPSAARPNSALEQIEPAAPTASIFA